MTAAVEPEIGDIGCVPIPGSVGWLISLGERLCGDQFTRYDHAFVVTGPNQIVEAEPDGARFAALSDYDPEAIAWVRCPAEFREAVAEAARGFLNTRYGFADYLLIALHRFHVRLPGMNRMAASTKTMICSQLAVESARRGGWDLLAGAPAGYITPADLARLATPND
jgi:hypothetical protein